MKPTMIALTYARKRMMNTSTFSRRQAERLLELHDGLEEKLERYHRLMWDVTHGDVAQTTEGKQRLREMLSDIEATYDRIVSARGRNSPPIDNAQKTFREIFAPEIKKLIDEPIATTQMHKPEQQMSAAQRRAMIANKPFKI